MVKAAMYDTDSYYLNRIVNVLNEKFSEELHLTALKEHEVEGVIRNHVYPILIIPVEYQEMAVSNNQPVVYLAKNRDEAEENGAFRIFAFSTAMEMKDALMAYQQIISMYQLKRSQMEHGHLLTFVSLGGGMGASCLAAGAAAYAAKSGKKVLFVSARSMLPTGYFELKDAPLLCRDVMCDIDNKKGQLQSMLEHMGKDEHQISVMSASDEKLEIMEPEKLGRLLLYVDQLELFDYVIVIMDVTEIRLLKKLGGMSANIITALDESSFGKQRYQRMEHYLKHDTLLLNKIRLVFNKFTSMPDMDSSLQSKVIGGMNYIQGADPLAVVKKLENMKSWESIL